MYGRILLLTLYNKVIRKVDMFEAFSGGHILPVNSGMLVILDQGRLIWVYNFKVADPEANGKCWILYS